MLLQHIVNTLDQELDRLHRLRAVVEGLHRPSVLDLAASAEEPQPAPAPEPVQTPEHKQRTPRQPRVATKRAPRVAVVEKTALAGSIPAGPIVVSAKALAEQSSRRVSVEKRPEVKPGTLGSMIRALHLDASL